MRELLTFTRGQGVIHFLGQRTLLVSVAALWIHRAEIIREHGPLEARRLFTRLGYAHGWVTAKDLASHCPELIHDKNIGYLLHCMQGQMTLKDRIKRIGKDGQVELWDAIAENSYEAESHLQHDGLSHEPVCWHMTGYFSGFNSFRYGREIYFMEETCQAMGAPNCRLIGKPRELWGPELEPILGFFQTSTLDPLLWTATSQPRAEATPEIHLLNRENSWSSLPGSYNFIGKSASMAETLDMASRVARMDSSILVTGETGVGKERIARLIHDHSSRSTHPFVAINCGALTETLLESELFGHCKGAFTGADRDHSGLFEAAGGGTLFLDEVGELPQSSQIKLLRALQEREVRRVGESRTRSVDLRIIAATNRDLAAEVAAGRFREDFYYRLRVIELHVPPLRDRPEDIMPLARHFLKTITEATGRQITGFSPQAATQMLNYAWPGNVRELRNAVERAVALCLGTQVGAQDLPAEVGTVVPRRVLAGSVQPLEAIEQAYILAALHANGGNKARTAAELGIGVATLFRKLKAYSNAEGHP
ncbi:MAG: sigma 54-interacting transcriptional regulator [Holophaga sp.]|nr:sigma 54-interacting transcriptional regulator [Holophaga sp.]